MKDKDDNKSKELEKERLVSQQLPVVPTGGRLTNFYARVREMSATVKIKSTTIRKQSEEELYSQVVKTAAAFEAARLAELRFNKLPSVLEMESERLDLELSVTHQENMQELKIRADSLGLSEEKAKLTIEQGFADVEEARKQLLSDEKPFVDTSSAEDKLCKLREEREKKAYERWSPRIEAPKTARDKAEAEESLSMELRSIREWFNREFNKILGNM